MKIIRNIILIGLLGFLFSCNTETLKFPVSDVTPAADITVQVKKEGEPNYQVIIEANNLASPERIRDPKKIYVIWAISEEGVVRNVGHFYQENAEKATYKASFPYQPVEIFITAENEQGNCTPNGIEISRVNLLVPQNKK